MGEHYKLLIIGGGTGGLRAAVISAKNGYKTALVEPGHIGGTCLNTGCIPTKTLIHAADVYTTLQNAKEVGIKATGKVDFPKVMNRMHRIVHTGRHHAEDSVNKMKHLTLIKGKAEFVSKNSVKVHGTEISADKIIIATGASPWVPPINGLDKTGYVGNEQALQLKKLPKNLVVIGGGYIAIELSCFFARLGSKVTVLERMPTILSMLDQDVIDYMKAELTKIGLEIHNNVDIIEVNGKNGKKVQVKTKIVDVPHSQVKTYTGDTLLVATGRRSHVDLLKPEKAGVEHDRGRVGINDLMQTTNRDVYAIGDVHGRSPFAHTVKREAKLVLGNALMNEKNRVDYHKIPWAAFTSPVIGGVGMMEKMAKEKGFDVGIMKAEFRKTGKAKIIQDPRGFVKVIYDKKTRNLLGCVIVGPEADNLIHEFALLLNTPDPKIDYIQKTVHVHPTLAEVMEELREV